MLRTILWHGVCAPFAHTGVDADPATAEVTAELVSLAVGVLQAESVPIGAVLVVERTLARLRVTWGSAIVY